jgi:uncharacterized protein YeaO (DUF488 family)
VRLRRAYDEASAADGRRVLVDLLWPRGLSRDAAKLDEWLREVAPSDGLRRWYGHEPEKFAEFRRRYADELLEPERAAALEHLRQLSRSGPLTLLTATRDIEHSQAAVLAERLRQDAAAGMAAGMSEAEERGGDPVCWLPRVCQQCGSMADADPPTICPVCHAAMPVQ